MEQLLRKVNVPGGQTFFTNFETGLRSGHQSLTPVPDTKTLGFILGLEMTMGNCEFIYKIHLCGNGIKTLKL